MKHLDRAKELREDAISRHERKQAEKREAVLALLMFAAIFTVTAFFVAYLI
jgi:hypothetical protein